MASQFGQLKFLTCFFFLSGFAQPNMLEGPFPDLPHLFVEKQVKKWPLSCLYETKAWIRLLQLRYHMDSLLRAKI